MLPVIDVASYLIHLAGSGEEPDLLSNLRLQKLLYFVQGWSVAALGQPMFQERIEAWVKGPVVKDLYHHFKDYGYRGIPLEAADEPKNLRAEDRAFIRAVWEEYKGFSTTALVELVHKEKPWLDARKGLAQDERSSREITCDAMKAWFEPQVADRFEYGLPIAQTYRAVADMESKPGKSHTEVFAALRRGR
jgi:uncharacterized phage-associated protein